MMSRLAAVAFAGLLLLPAALSAQVVEGRLASAASGGAVQGALVTLVDAGGGEVRETLSDSAGAYRLAAPAAGTYRVRVERVGYTTVNSAAFALGAGQVLAFPLRLAEESFSLEGLRVEARPRCEVRARDGRALEQVWNEARKALRITARTAADSSLAFEYTSFRRQVDPDGRISRNIHGQVILDTTTTAQAVGAIPFASAPAGSLSSTGFVQPRADSAFVVFHAPDAEVLLSDEFLDTHCFRLVRGGRGERGMLGLAFEPVPGVSRPDVRGTLWLDARSAELRYLEFTYTGLRTPSSARRMGGRVDFARLPGGAWIVRN